MKYSAILYEKMLEIEVSQRAENVIVARSTPLIADIHLIFGCLVVKRVWFKDQVSRDIVFVTEKLGLSFNVVRYAKTCRIADIDNGAVPEDFPLVRERNKFVPDYLYIDYKKGQFTGSYTYDRTLKLSA